MNGATRIVVETVDLEPVLPTISLCRMPGFETSCSNGAVYESMMSEDYLNKTKDENCTGKPVALIHPENLTTMSMGSVASSQDVRTLLMGNLIRDERFEVLAGETLFDVLPIGPLTKHLDGTWKPINSDSDLVGRCFSFDLADHKEWLTLGKPATVRIIMHDDQRAGLKYSVQVHNQNESMLVGVLNMEEAMVPTTYVKQETQPMLNVEMKKHVSITNCSRNDTISKCIEDFLDEQFMNCNTESFHSYSCPLKELFERSYAAMGLRIAGYQQVVNTTGCKLPCTRYGYELTPVMRQSVDSMVLNTIFPARVDGGSSIILSLPQTEDMKLYREVPFYDATQLISDCGGTLGVFIGWSIWSLYDPLKRGIIWALAKLKNSTGAKI